MEWAESSLEYDGNTDKTEEFKTKINKMFNSKHDVLNELENYTVGAIDENDIIVQDNILRYAELITFDKKRGGIATPSAKEIKDWQRGLINLYEAYYSVDIKIYE